MLVGPSFGAKTTCYKVLSKAITYVTKDDIKYGELPVEVTQLNLNNIALYH